MLHRTVCNISYKGDLIMKMDRMIIQVPRRLKTKLDALRQRGTTAAGLIRHLLEKHFQQSTK